MTTILQLTDLHLLADKGGLLKGVNPWQSLSCVLDVVRSRQIAFDHLVVTGDLAHDAKPETYDHVREALGDWLARLWVVPGNHDDRSLARRVPMHSPVLTGLAVDSAPADRAMFSFHADKWRVIGLDTLVPGELLGELGDAQMIWLATELERFAAQPTLIFMHHPPVEVRSAWLDRIGLTDRDRFCRLIETSPQVRLICCGHIHQEFRASISHAIVLASPSTSVQFSPATESLVVDELPPGLRMIRMMDDTFKTEVVRTEYQHLRS